MGPGRGYGGAVRVRGTWSWVWVIGVAGFVHRVSSKGLVGGFGRGVWLLFGRGVWCTPLSCAVAARESIAHTVYL